MFHPASPVSVFAFLLVCGFVVAAFLRGIWRSARVEARDPVSRTSWVAGGVALWLALAAGLVASGWVQAVPVRLMVFGMGSMLVSLLVGLSRIGKWLAEACHWS